MWLVWLVACTSRMGTPALAAVNRPIIVSAHSKTTDCNSDLGCSLNGVCNKGKCICEPPWNGRNCGVLQLKPTPLGGAYGYSSTPFAVTSWGGNSLFHNGSWHLFVTEIEGRTCGLKRWLNQSSVTHAGQCKSSLHVLMCCISPTAIFCSGGAQS